MRRRPLPSCEGGGHSNANYVAAKIPEAERPREGDYAALFHINNYLSRIRTVFDLGGSVGNLFYCYSRYLKIPPNLIWTVCDLPDTNRLGEELASSNKEPHLRFTDRLSDASGTDLLVISGALHYFEQPLSQIIAGFANKPRYLLINRAALVEGTSVATVQDGDTYQLACILHNRGELVRGLEALGYELVDSWQIRGHSVIIPCYPDRSAPFYSGLFFRFGGTMELTAIAPQSAGSGAASPCR